jgi:hypothetical protein
MLITPRGRRTRRRRRKMPFRRWRRVNIGCLKRSNSRK